MNMEYGTASMMFFQSIETQYNICWAVNTWQPQDFQHINARASWMHIYFLRFLEPAPAYDRK